MNLQIISKESIKVEAPNPCKAFSVAGFLRKVFAENLGDDASHLGHKVLKIAVAAVLLESGFVEIDSTPFLLKGIDFDIKRNWYLRSYYYTLPNTNETVKIKFQNLGNHCKVYGSLINGTEVHSVLVYKDTLVPFLNMVRANCEQAVTEKLAYGFWRKMKDKIALPLRIELCYKAGLELPLCFIKLPTELKLNILELVSGVDLAKVSCVCSELRYLGTSDYLWKQKCVERLGNVAWSQSGTTFKEKFAKSFGGSKKRKIAHKYRHKYKRVYFN